MKKIQRICLGGGVLLLVTIFIVSIFVVVVPQRTNAAETLTNTNAIQWKVVNLDGTHEQNKAQLDAVSADTEYVKYVLQVDWDCPEQISATGKNIIWDFNGHHLTFTKCVNVHFGYNERPYLLEFTDSSVNGNGGLEGYPGANSFFTIATYIIVSGGSIHGKNQSWGKLIMTGGKIDGDQAIPFPNFPNSTHIFVPNYVTVDHDQYQYTTADNIAHAGFAVSTSDIVSGAYNSAYGTGWNLAAGDYLLEKLTQKDTPYYLWYRASDTVPYCLLLQLV